MEREEKLEGMVVEDICNCDEVYEWVKCGEDEVCESEVEDHEEDEEEYKEQEICWEEDV
jgi:hypothetical protein